MPDVAYVIRTRERKEQRHRNNPWAKIGLGCAALLSLIIALTGILIGFIYISLTRDLPPMEVLPLLVDDADGLIYQPSLLYDRSGEHVIFALENPAATDRQYLTLDTALPNHIPANLITTTLALSDPDFWQHPGIELASNDTSTEASAAPPTLARRLVSDLLLWDRPSGLQRSLQESLLAAQITARYGREQVLTWYLNTANYGRLAFGADAAARVYFGKPAAELTLAEAAVLAAVSEAPALNPLDSPQAALERQQALLQAMVEQGVISAGQGNAALVEELVFQPVVPVENNPAPYFAKLVLDQISQRMDLARLERGGYRVITSLDYDLQLQIACTAASQKARLRGQEEQILTADGGECEAARLLPTLPQNSAADQVGVLAANVIVYDPNQGQVLAMVGYPAGGNDPSSTIGHPAGTSISPMVYLTAFTRGMSPATLLWDIPALPGTTDQEAEYQGPVRLRSALSNDYLHALNNTITQVGIDNIWRTIQQLGLFSGEASPPSSTDLLSQYKTSLIELSQAYSIFAAQGIMVGEEILPPNGSVLGKGQTNGSNHLQPVTILLLEDSLEGSWPDSGAPDGNTELTRRPVINPQLAYLITDVLSDESARWPSLGHPNPLEIGRSVASKIGTTAAGLDAWTIGYTPERLVGVWLGAPDGQQPDETLAINSAALWNAVMQYVLKDIPIQKPPAPPGINRLDVCNPSGLLPSDNCPDVVNEVFLAGTEPTQVDNLYQSFQINRETGRLATAFTPPEVIDEQVYLIVPPEAESWAKLAGLPKPPDAYDIIQAQSGSHPDVKISEPGMFSHVRDRVVLVGTAAGDDFLYYRLQVGSGLNPRTWLQIGEVNSQPVQDGVLGSWDATGLDGLHTIQLQVVRNDQRVDAVVTQVTVDNQPPQVTIVSPMDGEQITPRARQITLLADVQDNLEIYSVAFYLDDTLIETRYQTPYAIPWQSKPGEHSLRVVAADNAGNQVEDSIEFSISP